MIPQSQLQNIEITTRSTSTWQLDLEAKKLGGRIEGIDAVRQMIYTVLNVERYRYAIHSWRFGVELDDLYGQSMDYIYPTIVQRITEALMMLDTIQSVDNFSFDRKKEALILTFNVSTIYGDLNVTKEVTL
ncbi:DUF2634 domain-containing protein [Fusibacter paucivorans]|uniref:DUF2634 domain-containing protein n=1 Tax=Fusibacter paucivorans TaxID=76009 RepID=A0ABS5PRP8_9FIRM|nr:DUF2634 domain-containing protein [Fusibacter paucivorans]MBS7527843.1 DUF2634 domain-containing protein [Fusibacter paucivorans]